MLAIILWLGLEDLPLLLLDSLGGFLGVGKSTLLVCN